jgi:hypothetical protein
MASQIPRVRSDIKQLNKSLGDIVTRLDSMSKLDKVFDIDTRPYDDVTSKLDGIARLNKKWAEHLDKVTKKTKIEQAELTRLEKKYEEIQKLQVKDKASLDKQIKDLKEVNKQIEIQKKRIDDVGVLTKVLGKKWGTVADLLGGSVARGIDHLGKMMVTLGLDVIEAGFAGLSKAIENAYELFERWAQALGEFRNRIGVTSKNMGELTQAATQVEGVFYGLTDQFGLGIQAVGDFAEGLGRVIDVADPAKFRSMVVQGTEVARVLGLSAEEAGGLARSFQQMGEEADFPKLMGEIAVRAKTAGVSTAKFSKDLAQSSKFLVSFGKEGRKAFLDTQTYAEHLGVSMESMKGFTHLTDTFEGASEAAAKMNNIFGTSINSLQLMLESDPSKRLEMVRSAMKGQGQDFEHLSRQKRDFIAETLHLSEDEVAGVLSSGKTLNEIQAEQAENKKKQVMDEKSYRDAIRLTATTLFSFKQAWDRVTLAIFKMIKPFTDALGLTKAGKEGFAGFGEAMSSVTNKVVGFIDRIAGNDGLKKLLSDMGSSFSDLLNRVLTFTQSPEFSKWIDSAVADLRELWESIKMIGRTLRDDVWPVVKPVLSFMLEHAKALVIAFGALKAIALGLSAAQGIAGLAGLLGGGGAAAAGGAAAGGIGLLGSAGLVGAAGVAGYGVGTGIDKGVTALMGGNTIGNKLGNWWYGDDEKRQMERADTAQSDKTHALLAKQANEKYKATTAAPAAMKVQSADFTEGEDVSVQSSTGPSTNLARKKMASSSEKSTQETGSVYLDKDKVGKVLAPVIGRMMVRDMQETPEY